MSIKNVYCLGDIHGQVAPVREFCDNYQTNPDEDVLILLGDVGANFFFNHRDKKLKIALSKLPLTYFCIRGNHEERVSICVEKAPEKWHKEIFFDEEVYVENDYPNIKYAVDTPMLYKIPTRDGKFWQTLVLPGAYSVDKFYRLENHWSWFPQEQLTQAEMEYGSYLAKICNHQVDIILSHTCPISLEPTDLFLSYIDQSTVDETMERWLNTIEYDTDYKLWLFGHFHSQRVYPLIDGKKQVIMLYNENVLELNDWMSELPGGLGKWL